jgi:predicted nucleic acid-binding protein
MIVVSKASPLIALAKIGQLQLLCSVDKEIHISSAVREEVTPETLTTGRLKLYKPNPPARVS